MIRLWIADVHANLPAFEAVLRDIGHVDEVIFLGDIVGYGPHPSSCVELLRSLKAKIIVGNHDLAIISSKNKLSVRSNSMDWDDWTYHQLNDSQLAYLASLPAELTVESCGVKTKVIHHLPGSPYLHPRMSDDVLAEHFTNVSGRAIFCGHSHRQIDRVVRGRRLVCLPSVGQARNSDPRAGYAVEKYGELQFRYVTYDIEMVVSDVASIGFPETFCQRWTNFLRTGFDREWSRE